MDFHAVFDAAIDGYWYVFDVTHPAPRQSMTRIGTRWTGGEKVVLSLPALVGWQ
jgi:hypothetical protein